MIRKISGFITGLSCLVSLSVLFWPDDHTYLRLWDIPTMSTGYRAKELCSCLFVLEQNQEYCAQWTKDISYSAAYQVDQKSMRVEAYFTLLNEDWHFFRSQARFLDARRGCILMRPT